MIKNECPAQDNIINCRECPYECKLRMETNDVQTSEEVPPEPPPADIYY